MKYIIRFHCDLNEFSEEEIELFWSSREFDDEVKKEIYKILPDCSYPMNEEVRLNFLGKLAKISHDKMIEEEVDVIHSLGKFRNELTSSKQKIA